MNAAPLVVNLGSAFRSTLQRDPLLLPAILVALAGTAFAAAAPPAWLKRVPIAVQDVATGAREGLSGERDELAAREMMLAANLATRNDELSVTRGELKKTEDLVAGQQEQQDVLSQRLAQATARLNALDAEQGTLQTALQQERNRAVDLDERRQQLEHLSSQLRDEREAFREKLAASEADRAALDDQAAAFEQNRVSLSKAEANVRTLSRDLEILRAERDEVTEKLAAAMKTGDAVDSRIEAFQADQARLERELATAVAERSGLAQQLSQANMVSANLSSQLAATDAKASRLTTEQIALEGQLEGSKVQAQELQASLEDIQAERDRIEDELSEVRELARLSRDQRESMALDLTESQNAVTSLRSRLANAEERLSVSTEELKQARELARLTESERDAMAANLAELRGTVTRLTRNLAEAEERFSASAEELEKARKQALDLRQEVKVATAQIAELNGEVGMAAERRRTLETNLVQQTARLRTLNQDIDHLVHQRSAFQEEALRLLAMLRAASRRLQEQERVIEAGRANVDTLSGKVAELGRFRSDFLMRLSALLGDRDNVRVVGDRFVFQAEVLFDTGSAKIGVGGQAQLSTLASSLKDIEGVIPKDLKWFLRIDGHTDQVPIRSDRFASNWELSQARALAVVHMLISLGVPPNRLAANGFGEYQPIEESDADGASRQNRRIEIKLDQRQAFVLP